MTGLPFGVIALLAGCSFDTSGVGRVVDWGPTPVGDGPLPIADGAPDRPEGVDGRGDRAPPGDLARADTAPPADVAVPDVLAPDLTVDVLAPDTTADSTVDLPPPSCDDLYGSVPGYTLCEQTTGSCRFFGNLGGQSCDQICGGQACIAMEDDASGGCQPESPMDCGGSPCTCASTLSSGICTCGR